MKLGKKAPELKEILGWVNSAPQSLEEQKGSTVLLFFWDHTCLGCIQEIPFIEHLAALYKSEGLKVLSVHSAEFEFAKHMDNLETAVQRYRVSIPVAQDDRNATWLEYGNRYIPRTFLITTEGILAYEHIGTGDERAVEQEIRNALLLESDDVPIPLWIAPRKKIAAWHDVTPPTYMGFREILSIGRNASYEQHDALHYTDTGSHESSKVYLQGSWKQYDRYIEHYDENEGYMRILCTAQKAYAVMCAPEKPLKVYVHLDGKSIRKEDGGGDIEWDDGGHSFVLVHTGRIYHLTRLEDCSEHELSIHSSDKMMQLYSLQFE